MKKSCLYIYIYNIYWQHFFINTYFIEYNPIYQPLRSGRI